MSNQPLVSVIIIFLNGEKFIQEAIDSVFDQTYSHWELLLVDDGSTDASTDIALRYAEQYPGVVRYLEHHGHQNRGMSASRNQGLNYAKGEYIAFLDADDVWFPHKLAEQVAILESHPQAAMVYGPRQSWYSWTGTPEDIPRDGIIELGVERNTVVGPPRLLTLFLLEEYTIPSPSTVLVRRSVIDERGRFEEAFRDLYEDMVFYAKLCLRDPVFVAGECWYRHRRHADSSCAVAATLGLSDSARLTFLNWLAGYMSGQQVKTPEVWKVLQRQLWPYRHPTSYRLLGPVRHAMVLLKSTVKLVARQILPAPARLWLRSEWERYRYSTR